jgi:voltage-gated potassium channel
VVTRKPLTVRRAARLIASVTITMTLIGGVAIHFADRHSFPDVGDGLWWAVQTVTTVGYGDLVPRTTLGRVVASIVMLGGIAFLTVVTATITSAFIETMRRRLQPIEMSTLDGKLDTIAARLDAIEAELRRE